MDPGVRLVRADDPAALVGRMAVAAARTPGTAFLLTGADGPGPPRACFALGATERVRVPHDAPERGLAAFADGLAALAAERAPDARSPTAHPVAFGWLGYDAARAARDRRPPGDHAPCAFLATYDAVLALDRTTGALTLPGDPARAAALLAALDDAGEPPAREALAFTSATDRAAHERAVHAVRASILDGEVYLVNVARMLHAPPPSDPAVLAARVLASGAPLGCVLHAADCTVAGMSMELALAWDRARGVARTGPIKGTRPRRADPADDHREAEALRADPKERAENVMAVDVHRNDLGRVAAPGSVRVAALCAVASHAYVHHLVSTVEARIPAAVTHRALLAAMLPVGSVTGAPKLAAMDAIARVEPERRGVYTGVYGCAYADGSLELAVAIRTLVADGHGVHYGVGGGIVWDSVPAREWEELAWKERAAAVGADPTGPGTRLSVPR